MFKKNGEYYILFGFCWKAVIVEKTIKREMRTKKNIFNDNYKLHFVYLRVVLVKRIKEARWPKNSNGVFIAIGIVLCF
jgi:hypothetical protein